MAWPEDASEPEYGLPPFDSRSPGQEWIDACGRALQKLAEAKNLPKGTITLRSKLGTLTRPLSGWKCNRPTAEVTRQDEIDWSGPGAVGGLTLFERVALRLRYQPGFYWLTRNDDVLCHGCWVNSDDQAGSDLFEDDENYPVECERCGVVLTGDLDPATAPALWARRLAGDVKLPRADQSIAGFDRQLDCSVSGS